MNYKNDLLNGEFILYYFKNGDFIQLYCIIITVYLYLLYSNNGKLILIYFNFYKNRIYFYKN